MYLSVDAAETLACGTGACASLVAAVLTGRSARTNKVHLRGGTLNITWQDNNHVLMTVLQRRFSLAPLRFRFA